MRGRPRASVLPGAEEVGGGAQLICESGGRVFRRY